MTNFFQDLERKLEEVFSSHLKRAKTEGSAFGALDLALMKELVMTTASDLQGKINTLSGKFSQVEADVSALVAKEGSTAPNAGGASLVTQDQLDSMGTAVDGLSSRADALVQLVVNGPANAPAPSDPNTPPSTTPVTTTPPVSPTTPAAPPASPTPSAPGAPSTPPTS